jgi:hypothetical protein
MCRHMARTRVKGNGIKAASSPHTEPNFYMMEYCVEEDTSPDTVTLGLVPAASGGKVNQPPIHLAGPRLSSEGSWLNGQHVQAKPLAFLSIDENATRLVAAATAAPLAASSAPSTVPRVYGDATTSILSQPQDVINENNKLLLIAALQAGLGGLSQPPRPQQAPVFDLKDIDRSGSG